MSADTLSPNPIPAVEANTPAHEERIERGYIDASVRLPILLFFGTSLIWLVVGSLLACIYSLQLNYPWLLDAIGFVNFGRIYPAQTNALLYGWASAAGIGVAIWLMARLARTPLPGQRLLVSAGIAWNVGLLLGTLGILSGYNTGVEGLELPRFASGLMFLSFILIAVWAWVIFSLRRKGSGFVSQWYILAGFLLFPWIYGTANFFLTWCHPIAGSAQGPIQFWYAESFFSLWLTSLGLAAAYYMIPKITGCRIYSSYLAGIGFWSLILIAGWTGMYRILGGPIPAWMGSVSVAAGILMILPIVAVGLNFYKTLAGNFDQIRFSPALRFTVIGSIGYLLWAYYTSLMAFPAGNALFRFTDLTIGQWNFGLYGFYSMIIFGAMYYIVPRLIGWEWACVLSIKAHFWLLLLGLIVLVGASIAGGVIQGMELANSEVAFKTILGNVAPFRLLRTLGFLVVALSNLIFAGLFFRTLLKFENERKGPALLAASKTLSV